MSNAGGIHTGHRQRLKERIREFGIKSLSPHEILEYLLFFGIPYKDTNELAHTLIKTYGSLSGVLNAKYEDIVRIPNMTSDAAQLLTSLPAVFSEYVKDGQTKDFGFDNANKTVQYLSNEFLHGKQESVRVLFLDGRAKLIKEEKFDSLIPNRVNVTPREVLERAIANRAVNVIIAHNHPSGDCMPSLDDIEFTQTLELLMKGAGINFCDHIIFTPKEYFSFKVMKVIKLKKVDETD